MDSVKSAGFVEGKKPKTAFQDHTVWDDEQDLLEEPVKRLTKQEVEVILGSQALRPNRLTVKRLLSLQVLVTILCVGLWSAKGKAFDLDSAAVSALFGGLCALLPAALFAARARVFADKAAGVGATVFALVTGELLKIIATVVLFVLAIVFYPGLQWLPMLLTYILAIKCYLLAWIVK